LGAQDEYVAELVRRGLWETTAEGVVFHDWLEWQPSREQVETRREKTMLRVRKLRAARSNAVTNAGVTPCPDPVPESDSLLKIEELKLFTSEPSHARADAREAKAGGGRELAKLGYDWLMQTLGTFPPNVESWRADYERIGAKPEAERASVARNLLATPYIKARRSKATPGHLVRYWEQFVDGPRSFEFTTTAAQPLRGPCKVHTDAEYAAAAKEAVEW
jgi:hypothetical protein